MKNIVIVHPEMGIYLGTGFGLGFFSLLDCAGQEYAASFDNADQAREHIASWESNNDPTAYRFVEVECEEEFYATIEELEAAGLAEFTGPMRTERLRDMPVAGRA